MTDVTPNPSLTVTIPYAARALGISVSTAYERAKTGELLPGVPVVTVDRRRVVPTLALHTALTLPAPIPSPEPRPHADSLADLLIDIGTALIAYADQARRGEG